MKIVVLDGLTTNPGDLSWDFLSEFGTFTVYDRTMPEEVVPRAQGCEIILTNKTALTEELLCKLPLLRYVGMLSTGYNVVDTAYCKTQGIAVANIPTYGTAAVTQLTFALLLELVNQVGLHSAAVHEGEWTRSPDFCFQKTPLVELYGKTFGIIGFGKIGQAVAKVALAFGMRVITVSNEAPPVEFQDTVDFTELPRLLEMTDVVSLHVPLTAQTQGMVNADFLQQMRKSAYLINTARGPLVQEDALAAALNNGTIAGAGVDVLSTEPPNADNPLLHCKNCFITPHIAWAGYETRKRLLAVCEKNLRTFLKGEGINIVNL